MIQNSETDRNIKRYFSFSILPFSLYPNKISLDKSEKQASFLGGLHDNNLICTFASQVLIADCGFHISCKSTISLILGTPKLYFRQHLSWRRKKLIVWLGMYQSIINVNTCTKLAIYKSRLSIADSWFHLSNQPVHHHYKLNN